MPMIEVSEIRSRLRQVLEQLSAARGDRVLVQAEAKDAQPSTHECNGLQPRGQRAADRRSSTVAPTPDRRRCPHFCPSYHMKA